MNNNAKSDDELSRCSQSESYEMGFFSSLLMGAMTIVDNVPLVAAGKDLTPMGGLIPMSTENPEFSQLE